MELKTINSFSQIHSGFRNGEIDQREVQDTTVCNSVIRCHTFSSPYQKVIMIDHIIETILSNSDTKTIKNCRHLGSTWTKLGSSEVQKRISILINLNSAMSSNPLQFPLNPSLLPFQDQPATLKSLIHLIKGSDKFPSSSFTVTTNQLANPNFQNLLSNIGFVIQKLYLCIGATLFPNEVNFSDENRFHVHCKKLLQECLPNLQNLRVFYKLPFYEIPSIINEWQTTSTSSVGFLGGLPNLKSISIEGLFPEQTFEEIINSAPNLHSIAIVPTHESPLHPVSASLCRCFLKENGKIQNKVRLLKRIKFTSNKHTIPVFEQLLMKYSKYIRLESLELLNIYVFNRTQLHAGVAHVINLLLEISASTLTKLVIHSGFLGRVRIPVLPKLRMLELRVNFPIWLESTSNYFILEKFNWSSNLPSLRVLIVDSLTEIDVHFYKWFNINISNSHFSVRRGRTSK